MRMTSSPIVLHASRCEYLAEKGKELGVVPDLVEELAPEVLENLPRLPSPLTREELEHFHGEFPSSWARADHH